MNLTDMAERYRLLTERTDLSAETWSVAVRVRQLFLDNPTGIVTQLGVLLDRLQRSTPPPPHEAIWVVKQAIEDMCYLHGTFSEESYQRSREMLAKFAASVLLPPLERE